MGNYLIHRTRLFTLEETVSPAVPCVSILAGLDISPRESAMDTEVTTVYAFRSKAGGLVARIRALSEDLAWKALRDCVVEGKLPQAQGDHYAAVVMYDASEVPDRSTIRRRQYRVVQEV